MKYYFPRAWNVYRCLAWIRERSIKVTLYKVNRRLIAW